jgi:LuxR family maltose regulon positive regulatory protein
MMEIGPHDLSLTSEEASSLLRDAGVALGQDDVAELHKRTEGWPAGLYLAALYLREGGPFAGAAVSFGGDDRLVSDYMESEFLSRISRQQRVFRPDRGAGAHVRAAVRGGAGDGGSAAILADLAGSNLPLVPLDRRGEWYRYHHLFRDMLLAELPPSRPDARAAAPRLLVPGQRHA